LQTNFENYKFGDKTLSEKVRDSNYKQVMQDVEQLSTTQELVLQALQEHPEGLCDKEISKITGLPVTSVCARRNELVKMRMVASDGTIEYPDYRNHMRLVTRWRLTL